MDLVLVQSDELMMMILINFHASDVVELKYSAVITN